MSYFSIEGIDISNKKVNLSQFITKKISAADFKSFPDMRHDNTIIPFITKNDRGDIEAGTIILLSVNDKSSTPYFCFPHNKYDNFCLNISDVMLVEGLKDTGNEKIDLAPLNNLVIADDVKEEILAVIKQHENNDKIFKDWGLGDIIEYGKGMTFLFYGPPGTGKTWAANCIAKALGRKLMIVAAAEIQTSEPGGANRNIQQAFATAAASKKVLLLDECDSLITSRNDVGMIIGSEINTLLTEIEKYEGFVILTTNRIENLDEALERRIALIVEFPEPDFNARKELWKKMIPKKMPVGRGVSVQKLAEEKLTGGQIKNAVLQAARLAISSGSENVKLSHFNSAISRIHKSRSLLGTASRFRQVRVRDDFKKSS